jgi:hypothetical protein
MGHNPRVLRVLAVLAFSALLVSACSLEVDYSGSHFACDDGVCPSGFECSSDQVCVKVDPPDAGPDAEPNIDAPPAGFCEEVDQVLDPTTGHCFQLERTVRTWDTARVACNALGANAHLAYVTSTVQDALVAMLADGFITLAWIGATDSPTEDDWHWLDGRDFDPSPAPNALSFTAWNDGEPNDGGTSGNAEDCAAMDLKNNVGKWDDRQCGETRPSVCEIEP